MAKFILIFLWIWSHCLSLTWRFNRPSFKVGLGWTSKSDLSISTKWDHINISNSHEFGNSLKVELSMSFCFCLLICMSACSPVYLCDHPCSTRLSVFVLRVCIFLSICFTVYLPVQSCTTHLYVFGLFVCVFLSFSQSITLSVCLSANLSASPPIRKDSNGSYRNGDF
jgi:hypothetical protein